MITKQGCWTGIETCDRTTAQLVEPVGCVNEVTHRTNHQNSSGTFNEVKAYPDTPMIMMRLKVRYAIALLTLRKLS
ncbi:hypothetical protein, partial [Coleofasciculus sp.]|uniref:hypothetical protein n=1 Tax=Coleofasciculus sp. TaxID=3100458 RepID=UPI003A1966CD